MTVGERYLLDTNVISEAGKVRADPGVQSFLADIPSDQLFLSVMTIGELHKGLALRRRQNPEMGGRLLLWVNQMELSFRGQILDIHRDIATRWSVFSAIGRTRPVVDTLIAATADWYGMTLVSRNVTDFEDLPIKVLNPWAG